MVEEGMNNIFALAAKNTVIKRPARVYYLQAFYLIYYLAIAYTGYLPAF